MEEKDKKPQLSSKQLMDYVKKQKARIELLESQVTNLTNAATESLNSSISSELPIQESSNLLQQENISLHAELVELRKEYQDFKVNIAAKLTEGTNCAEELSQLKINLSNAMEMNRNLISDNQNYISEIEDLTRQLSLEHENYTSELNSKQIEISSKETINQQLSDEVIILKGQINALNAQISTTIAAATVTCSKLHINQEDYENEKSHMQNQIINLEEKLLQSQYSSDSNQIKLENENKLLQNEIITLQEQVKWLDEQLSFTMNTAATFAVEATLRDSDKNDADKNKLGEIYLLKESIEDLQNQLKVSQTHNLNLQDQLDSFNNSETNHNQSSSETNDIKQSTTTQEDLQREINTLNEQLANLKIEIENSQSAFKVMEVQNQIEVSSLQHQLSQAQSSSLLRLEELSQRIQSKDSKLLTLQQQVDELKNDLDVEVQTRSDVELEATSLREEVSLLQFQLESLQQAQSESLHSASFATTCQQCLITNNKLLSNAGAQTDFIITSPSPSTLAPTAPSNVRSNTGEMYIDPVTNLEIEIARLHSELASTKCLQQSLSESFEFELSTLNERLYLAEESLQLREKQNDGLSLKLLTLREQLGFILKVISPELSEDEWSNEGEEGGGGGGGEQGEDGGNEAAISTEKLKILAEVVNRWRRDGDAIFEELHDISQYQMLSPLKPLKDNTTRNTDTVDTIAMSATATATAADGRHGSDSIAALAPLSPCIDSQHPITEIIDSQHPITEIIDSLSAIESRIRAQSELPQLIPDPDDDANPTADGGISNSTPTAAQTLLADIQKIGISLALLYASQQQQQQHELDQEQQDEQTSEENKADLVIEVPPSPDSTPPPPTTTTTTTTTTTDYDEELKLKLKGAEGKVRELETSLIAAKEKAARDTESAWTLVWLLGEAAKEKLESTNSSVSIESPLGPSIQPERDVEVMVAVASLSSPPVPITNATSDNDRDHDNDSATISPSTLREVEEKYTMAIAESHSSHKATIASYEELLQEREGRVKELEYQLKEAEKLIADLENKIQLLSPPTEDVVPIAPPSSSETMTVNDSQTDSNGNIDSHSLPPVEDTVAGPNSIDSSAEVRRLQETLESMQSNHQYLQDNFEESQSQLMISETAFNDLKAEFLRYQVERDNQATCLSEVANTLRMTVAALEDELTQCRGALAVKEEECNGLHQKLSDLQSHGLESANANLIEAANSSSAADVASSNTTSEVSDHVVAVAVESAEVRRGEDSTLLLRLEEESRGKDDTILELESQLRGMAADEKLLRSQIESLQSQVEALTNQSREHVADVTPPGIYEGQGDEAIPLESRDANNNNHHDNDSPAPAVTVTATDLGSDIPVSPTGPSTESLLSEIEALQGQIVALHQQIELLQTQSSETLSLLTSSETSYCDLKIETEKYQQQYHDLKDQSSQSIASLTHQLDTLRSESKAKDDEIATSKSKIQKYAALMKAKKKEVDGLAQQISQLEGDKRQSLDSLSASESRAVTAENLITTLQQDMNSLRNQNDSLASEFQTSFDECASLRLQLTSSCTLSEQLNERIQELQTQVEAGEKSLKSMKDSATKRLALAHKKQEENKKKIEELLTKESEYQVKIEELNALSVSSMEREQSLLKRLSEMDSQLAEAEASDARHSIALKDHSKQQSVWKQSTSALTDQIASLQEQVTSLQDQVAQSVGDSGGKDEEISALKLKIMKYNALVKSKTKEVENLTQQLATTRKEQELAIANLQSDAAELNERISLQQDEIAKYRQQAESSTGQQQLQAEAALKSVDKEREMSAKKIDRLSNSVKALRKDKELLIERVHELEALVAAADSAKEECQLLHQQIKDMEYKHTQALAAAAAAMKKEKEKEKEVVKSKSKKTKKAVKDDDSIEFSDDDSGDERAAEPVFSATEKRNMEQKIKRLTDRSKILTDKLREANETIEELENTATVISKSSKSHAETQLQLAELKASLQGAEQRVSELVSEKEGVEAQLEAQRKESEVRIDAMAEKVKRMKSLLAKSVSSNQERELEIKKLKQHGGLQLMSFAVTARISVPSAVNSSENSIWCFVSDATETSSTQDSTASSPTASTTTTTTTTTTNGVTEKWVLESYVKQWITEGSICTCDAWPDLLQDIWEGSVKAFKESLEAETAAAKKEVADILQQFQAYKARAHSALKRVGVEDHGERMKLQLEENKKIQELQDTIIQLEQRLQDSSTEIQTLKKQCERLSAVDTEALSNQLQLLQRRLEEEQGQLAALQQRYEDVCLSRDAEEEARTLSEKLVADYKSELESLRVSTSSLKTNRSSQNVLGGEADSNSGFPRTPSGSRLPMGGTDWTASSPLVSGAASPSPGHSHHEGGMWSPSDVTASTNTSKSLLIQHTENSYREALSTLRLELSEITEEKEELTRMLALAQEQSVSLKENIRELEATLSREREFSPENRQFNIEYLVNVLKKFLQSTEAVERSKLVPVLCTILHFRPDESKLIVSKWIPPSKPKGLVGWLLPPAPPAASGHAPGNNEDLKPGDTSHGGPATQPTSSNTYNPYNDAIGGLDVY